MVTLLRALLAALAEKGTLVAPDAVERLQSVPEDAAREALLADGVELPFHLTAAEIDRLLSEAAAPASEPPEAAPAGAAAAPAEAVPAAPSAPAPDAAAPASPPPVPPRADGSAPRGAVQAAAGARQVAPASPVPLPAAAAEPSQGASAAALVAPEKPTDPATVVKGKPVPVRPKGLEPYAHAWDVLMDITGNSTCEGSIQDFTRYFTDRLNKIRKMLRQRRELVGFVPVKNVRAGAQAEVKVIGVVTEVRSTKNGHRLIELEDETGAIAILAPANNPHLISQAETVIEDEVIGVVCRPPGKGNLLILDRLVRPEIPVAGERRKSDRGSAVAILSDIHMGTNTFLEDDWERFVRWINGDLGDARMKQLARKVKYLIVNGDIVDGIGIFPGQENELTIPDAAGQYEYAAHQFARIRDDVKVFMMPGNHDMVRPAEPQPALPEKYQKFFSENITQVGNPAKISIEGVEFLGYHGFSMVDWNTRIMGLSFEDPVKTMKEMVQRRHMCPMYGLRTPIAPEHKDYLVMDTVPDVFITGHIHAAGMDNYRGMTLVNASCWQSQTPYQKMHGFMPDPGKVPVIELDNRRSHMLDFHRGAAGVDAVGRSKFSPTDPKVKPDF